MSWKYLKLSSLSWRDCEDFRLQFSVLAVMPVRARLTGRDRWRWSSFSEIFRASKSIECCGLSEGFFLLKDLLILSLRSRLDTSPSWFGKSVGFDLRIFSFDLLRLETTSFGGDDTKQMVTSTSPLVITLLGLLGLVPSECQLVTGLPNKLYPPKGIPA